MIAAVKLLALAAVLVTPLSPGERTILATARDDRSHEEEAFAVLLSHAASWTGALGDEPIRLAPNFAAMTDEPGTFRGELCRIEGRLEQRTGLGGAFEGDEWFIRTANGTPVVVYVPHDGAMKAMRDGQHVAMNARFYKRMRFTGRDGEARAYAAFVGARPWLVEAPNPWRHLWVLAAVVMILLVTFLVLFAIVKRGGGSRRLTNRAMPAEAEVVEDFPSGAALPADPAEALEELWRRQRSQP